MDNQEFLEQLNKIDLKTRKKLESELLKASKPTPEEESSKFEPLYSEEEIEQKKKNAETVFLTLFIRDLIRDPKILDKKSDKTGSLGAWLSDRTQMFRDMRKKPDEESDPANSISLKKLLSKTDFSGVSSEDLLSQALLRLIMMAKDHWSENKEITSFPGKNEFLSSELQDLAKKICPKLRLESIAYHYRTALYEIDNRISFNWKGFLEVFGDLTLPDVYSVYLVETLPHIWKKRRGISAQIIDQINLGRVFLPNGDFFNLDDRQQSILEVYYENEGNIPTLKAVKLAKIDSTIPDDPEDRKKWRKDHKNLNEQYRFSQIFRDTTLRNFLLIEVRRGVYRAAF